MPTTWYGRYAVTGRFAGVAEPQPCGRSSHSRRPRPEDSPSGRAFRSGLPMLRREGIRGDLLAEHVRPECGFHCGEQVVVYGVVLVGGDTERSVPVAQL